MRVEFIKAHRRKTRRWSVGEKAVLDGWLIESEGLLKNGIVKEYTGQWPPKGKKKINLKDLK